jgi:hypothetical protein
MKLATLMFLAVLGTSNFGVQQIARAQSDPALACTVTPGTLSSCSSNVPAPEYQARFQVPNPQVPTYTWSYYNEDNGTTHPLSCTTSVCYINTNAINDRFWDVYAEEVVTGRGPTTYEASLVLAAVCGHTFC